MTCQPFITLDEFKASPFFCHMPTCCATGAMQDVYIETFIDLAQSTVESYMGWDICLSRRTDNVNGDNSSSMFLQYVPVSPTGSLTITYKDHSRGLYLNNVSTIATGIITDFYVEDYKTGLIRFPYGFRSGVNYIIDYQAGYDPIPAIIKQAMNMLVLNLAQRLDNNNFNNPDLSIDSINVNKVAVATFGSSKMVKQIVMKSMKELIDLPVPVARILDRYRYGL